MLPAATTGIAARLAYRAAAFHAIVSNVPGPEVELSVLGRPLRAVYPAVRVAPGHALSVGALSYLGTLHVGLSADADASESSPGSRATWSARWTRCARRPRTPRPRGGRRPVRGVHAAAEILSVPAPHDLHGCTWPLLAKCVSIG